MKRRHTHFWSVALLLAMPVILLWPSLVGDRTFVPWDIAQFAPAATLMDGEEFRIATTDNNTIITETPTMFVPELRFLKSEFDLGRFPHWNPYSRSGTGAWSSSILGLWYPLNWMLFVGGDPEDELALVAFLSLAVAALLMYGLLIHLRVSIAGALFGALVFSLSGTLTVNLSFYQRVNALVWLPGLLWAISAISRREGYRRIPAMLGLAACMYMAHVAGFPAFALAVTLLAIVVALYFVVERWRREGFRSMTRLGFAIAGGALLGVVPSMIQTLPMFEFFPESLRTMEPKDNILASAGFDPAGWLGYFCPTIYNHPYINYAGGLVDQYSPLYWYLYSRTFWVAQDGIAAGTVCNPSYNFCEHTVFVGTLTLFLALAGLFGKKTPWRFLVLGMMGMFVFASSAHSLMEPVLEAAPFRWIPPPRYMGPLCMFLGFLAAGGVHGLHELSTAIRRGIWGLGYALSIVFAALAWWTRARTPAELLEELIPGMVAKHQPRHPGFKPSEIVSHVQDTMGPEMPMAHAQMVSNFFAAAVATFLCASLFLALPRILRWKHGHRGVLTLVFCMTAYELLSFGMPLCAGRELQQRPLNNTAVHEFLREQRDKHAGTGGFGVFRAHDPKVRDEPVILPSQLPPNTLLEDRIRDQQAYTFLDSRSHLPFLKLYGPTQLSRGTWPMSVADGEKLNLPYWDMLGIRFFLSEDVLKHAGTRVGPVLSGPANADTKTRHFYVYERSDPLPRAWVVHDFKVLGPPEGLHNRTHSGPSAGGPAEDAIVAAMVDPKFRPADEAIVDQPTVLALGANPHRSKTPGNTRKVSFPIPNQTSELTIEIDAGERGYLVVNDTLMSGWTVTVGGKPATIHRANLFQRMVEVPGEKVTVEFRYVTPGFHAGLALAVIGFLAMLALVWRYLVWRRRELNLPSPANDMPTGEHS